MEELNSWWARGRGGFAWTWLVKCRKVHKETLVLVHSIGFTEVKQSTFLSNKPKGWQKRYSSFLWSCRCVAAMPAEHDRSAHVYNLSHASLWELDSEAVGVFFVCVSCVCHLNEDALKPLTVWETDRSQEGCRRRWRKSRHLCRKWDWCEEGNNGSASDEKD